LSKFSSGVGGSKFNGGVQAGAEIEKSKLTRQRVNVKAYHSEEDGRVRPITIYTECVGTQICLTNQLLVGLDEAWLTRYLIINFEKVKN